MFIIVLVIVTHRYQITEYKLDIALEPTFVNILIYGLLGLSCIMWPPTRADWLGSKTMRLKNPSNENFYCLHKKYCLLCHALKVNMFLCMFLNFKVSYIFCLVSTEIISPKRA